MYNNNIAETVADMGYQSILCEKREDMFTGGGKPASPPMPCSGPGIRT